MIVKCKRGMSRPDAKVLFGNIRTAWSEMREVEEWKGKATHDFLEDPPSDVKKAKYAKWIILNITDDYSISILTYHPVYLCTDTGDTIERL